jgi:hypothetical protein
MQARRIERWLLEPGIQQRAGEHAGAVPGNVDAARRADYVYPEITGYYLQWLAWLARRCGRDDALAARAAAAQRWLGAWIGADDAPATRIYLHEAVRDWRNDAAFCFDLAMALRGVAAAHGAALIAAEAALVGRLCVWLSRLIGADGALDACLRHRASDAFPERWSTRRGAFLAKAAAGILAAARVLPEVPRELGEAARRTFEASLDALARAPHAETHPYLYAIEGFLSLPDQPDFAARLARIAADYDARIDEARRLGFVPESRCEEGRPRLDIVAQALRAGLLLDAHRSATDGVEQRREWLADTLIAHITGDGALPFAAHGETRQFNVWTAMFAEQALALRGLAPARLAEFAADPCIV